MLALAPPPTFLEVVEGDRVARGKAQRAGLVRDDVRPFALAGRLQHRQLIVLHLVEWPDCTRVPHAVLVFEERGDAPLFGIIASEFDRSDG